VGWGLVVALCFGAPWLTRGLLLREKGTLLALADLRGFLSDASIALLVLGAVGLSVSMGRYWGRALGLLVLIAFVMLSFAMYEFISVFDSLYALSHVGFLTDSVFLGGSAVRVAHPLLLGSFLLSAIIAASSARRPSGRCWRWWGIAFAVSVVGQVAIPLSHQQDEWRQRHAIYANLAIIGASPNEESGTISAEVRGVFRGNLRGKRWIGPLRDRPNVLLIMVEGASGAYLPSVAAVQGVESATQMPKLDALGQEHIVFTQVISHQRQTNRGEYGILCGDYPKLLTDQSKMSEQTYGSARQCLPQVLRERGYTTTYIQAAPLGFMLKDQFMKKAGFDEIVGDPWFEKSYARTDWGVDDKAFFEQSVDKVVALHEAPTPFFATLLTVGTHHPFTIPANAGADGAGSRQERAFRWADDALAAFLDELRRRGVLRDTVVVITSDESAGLARAESPTQRLLSQSWSFVVVMLPTGVRKRIDTLEAHVDTALSVIDLLGIEGGERQFLGRSWFRDYSTPRPVFAGNTYARRVIMWEASGSAVICTESFRDCTRTIPERGLVFGPSRRSAPAEGRERQLLAEVARLTRSGRRDMTEAEALDLLTQEEVIVRASEGKKLLIGGQYLRVPAGTNLNVVLDLEVLGDGAVVDFHQDVFLNGHSKFERTGFLVRNGERWKLRYEIGVPDASDQLVVQLYATAVAGGTARIRFNEARLGMLPAAIHSEAVRVIEDATSRPDPH
jgi:arylsulfatase A-like enzyme